MIDSALLSTNYEDNRQLLSFLAAQLWLCATPAKGRRYPIDLIILSFSWRIMSTALYKKMSEIFILPSVRRLQQLSTGSAVTANSIDLAYMSTRTCSLTEEEKNSILIIDEVNTSSRVEYHGGNFVGLLNNGEVAKTVLVFMVQSLLSKYKDVVKLIPVSRLKGDLLKEYFTVVVSELHRLGLEVVAVSVDNHPVN